ncbi:PH domain-containing protein [Pirellulaceae bacterium SH467]
MSTEPEKMAIPPRIERPDPALLTYYILCSFLSFVGVVLVLPLMWVRYSTLRYQLEPTGIRMQVGWMFRREVVVAFRRIQDIQISSNVIQRWLGIYSVSIQTASGNAMPEIVIEGVREPEAVRDWLYARTRGASIERKRGALMHEGVAASASRDEALQILREIRNSLDAIADGMQVPGSKAGGS